MTVPLPEYLKLAAEAQERRENQLPEEYRIPQNKFPDASVKDVSRFPQESGLFDAQELEITGSTAREIVENIKSKTWTSVQVCKAFCKRAAYAQQLVNCLSEMFFERALERAKYLDDYYEREGKLVGPFHGLPISIKDHHQIKGTTCSVGFTAWAVKTSSENAAMVELLYDLGAVLYCKTSVPVAMMMPDTESHAYGLTVSPLNRSHSAGGSSGGEGALISFGGSPLGVGSDIGGSIRIPAHYNGLFGLKPTGLRFPIKGTVSGLRGQNSIQSIVGPLSSSLDSVKLFAQAVIEARPELYDEVCVPVPWRAPVLEKKLVFGIVKSDNYVTPTPAVQRALQNTIKALESQGHEVIEWEPYKHDLLDSMLDSFFTADGGKFVAEVRNGEPLFPYMAPYGKAKELGVSKLWEMNAERLKIKHEYAKKWNESGKLTKSGRVVDGIICPASPVSSHPSHHFTYVGYTSVWNALDYPSVIVPVLRADARIDRKPAHEPLSKKDAKVWNDYDPDQYDGGCVGIQVICRPFEDEKALELADTLLQGLKSLS